MMNEMNVSADLEEKSKKKPSAFSRFIRKHPLLTAIICGLLVVVAVYFAKEMEGNMKRNAVIKAASTELQENNQTMLKLLCKPLVWSIRSEMLRGNMEQVNLLISDLVKEKNFLYIHLIDSQGKVLLSTNKKMEGQPVANAQIEQALTADSTVALNEEGNVITVISPVMGYDKQLATLVLSYQPEEFGLEKVEK